MFVMVSFILAPNSNNPTAPSTRKLINKPCYFYTMETLFNNLKSELLMHTAAWVNHKTLRWVKETRHKWVYTVWFHLYETQEHATLIYGCSNKNSCLSEVGMTPKGHKGTFWGDENTLFWLWCWLRKNIHLSKCHRFTHLNYVHFTVGKSYLELKKDRSGCRVENGQ